MKITDLEIAEFIISILMVVCTTIAIFTALFKERMSVNIKCKTIMGVGYDRYTPSCILGIKIRIVNNSPYPLKVESIDTMFECRHSKLFKHRNEDLVSPIYLRDTLEPFSSKEYVLTCHEINKIFKCGSRKEDVFTYIINTPVKSFKIKTNYSGSDIYNSVTGVTQCSGFDCDMEDVKTFFLIENNNMCE